ncbi:MAG: hypothetical protein OHK0012_07220 [Synechococcales cyanobacterium]
MAKKSPAFQEIRASVLAITAAIPPGRLCTFAAMGKHLNVMARHVAYILATLTPAEQVQIPWHRVVSEPGVIRPGSNPDRIRDQVLLLTDEGIPLTPDLQILDFEQRRCHPSQLVAWDYRHHRYGQQQSSQ